ncbi:hypothetical protein GO988_06215 [Hymenobacter sp. HMF4947]|uniref:OmpA-like domain-containing protein n=1 Tax=Hymenobacter ginkgonis TaxID=2682976 RepID=A0A7K1TBY6_9BACT|nr:hypothetical protein [Hymenobacter ginkgonis]MVN75917.1 hypothetical protein [Hymenobacter ginkgonis]
MNQDRKDFFWPSYVDLMTALFLVMLVLFVLSYKRFQDKQASLEQAKARLEVQLKEKKKLDEIRAALARLEDPRYFVYNQQFKRYELSFNISFAANSSELPAADKPRLLAAGRFMLNKLSALGTKDNIQYLVVIEGRTARFIRSLPSGGYSYDDPRNFDGTITRQISYLRALAVYRLWREAGIEFPAPRYEVMPAGSGFGGVGRYQGAQEDLNRRFIIQIQPKIGSLGR